MPYNVTILQYDNSYLRHIIIEEDNHDGELIITQYITDTVVIHLIIKEFEQTNFVYGRVRTPLYDSINDDDNYRLERIKFALRTSYIQNRTKMPVQYYHPISARIQMYRDWFNKTIAEIVKVGAEKYVDNLNNNLNELKGI